jgi:hypothetical protein
MEDEEAPAFRLGGLTLRAFSSLGDAPYEDWLDAHARVEAPGAVVEVRGTWLRCTELASLHHDLAAMQRDLRGSAALHCLEPMLRIDMACGRRGEIAMTVGITPDLASQAHRFDFALDQTDLAPALAGLRRILRRHPPPGRAAEFGV